MGARIPWLLVAGTAACAGSDPGDDPITAGPVPGVGDGAAMGTGSDDSGDGATGWQGVESDGSGGASSGGPDAGDSDSSGAADAGGDDAGSGDATEDTSGDGGSSGEPPPVDLWAPCNDDADCGTSVCVVLTAGGTPLGGYCSALSCVDPAPDCGAPPAGTATPICLDIMDEDMQVHSACALDCSGGASCPPGLTCIAEVGSLCI